MKNLPLLAVFSITVCLLGSCASSRNSSGKTRPKKSKITGVRPNVKTPSVGVVNASGDALTPGINSASRNGAGSEENAAAIANNAITKANTALRRPQLKLDTIGVQEFLERISSIESRASRTNTAAMEATIITKIKQYAATLIKDHQLLINDLEKIRPGNKNEEIIIATLQLFNSAPRQTNASSEKDGTSFDTEYLQKTIQDHQNMIRLLEAGRRSKDASISSFSAKYLPVLKQHLSAAQNLTIK